MSNYKKSRDINIMSSSWTQNKSLIFSATYFLHDVLREATSRYEGDVVAFRPHMPTRHRP